MYLVLSRIPLQFNSFLWIRKQSRQQLFISHFGHVYFATLESHTSHFPNLPAVELKMEIFIPTIKRIQANILLNSFD